MTLEAVDDEEFRALSAKIALNTAFRCASYKERCLRRRIAVRMRARGTESLAAYSHLLDGDADEYESLMDALTVNVTRFFRDPSTFGSLARLVIPELWRREGPIAVWSAGCSSGEEAISLAALFYRHAAALGQTHRLGRVRVVGSDIDRRSVAAARRGLYPAGSFVDTAPELLDEIFPRVGDERSVIPTVRALVSYERRDILTAPAEPGTFDLVACRNVVIYLGRAAQEELLLSLHAALRVGGYLVTGHVENLMGAPRELFGAVDSRERVYRKRQ